MLEFNQYQKESAKTAKDNIKNNLSYLSLGLAGEVGEVCEKIKKSIRDDTEINKKDIGRELGDVLWYLTQLASYFSIEMSEVANVNLDKLFTRLEEGKISGNGDYR